jgi:hypothetical protein
MTPAQYEKAVAALGLTTKDEAAELLGVDVRTIERYLDGSRSVPTMAVNFINYLLRTKRSGSYAIKQIKKGRA